MQRVRGALKRQDNGISVLFPRRYPHCYQEMQGMRLCHCCALIHELESGSRLMASALLTQSRKKDLGGRALFKALRRGQRGPGFAVSPRGIVGINK